MASVPLVLILSFCEDKVVLCYRGLSMAPGVASTNSLSCGLGPQTTLAGLGRLSMLSCPAQVLCAQAHCTPTSPCCHHTPSLCCAHISFSTSAYGQSTGRLSHLSVHNLATSLLFIYPVSLESSSLGVKETKSQNSHHYLQEARQDGTKE